VLGECGHSSGKGRHDGGVGECLREIFSQKCSDVGIVPKPPNLRISDESLTRPLSERQPAFA
jgi:hypothetical protein